jgi:hypothetical protein
MIEHLYFIFGYNHIWLNLFGRDDLATLATKKSKKDIGEV